MIFQFKNIIDSSNDTLNKKNCNLKYGVGIIYCRLDKFLKVRGILHSSIHRHDRAD